MAFTVAVPERGMTDLTVMTPFPKLSYRMITRKSLLQAVISVMSVKPGISPVP